MQNDIITQDELRRLTELIADSQIIVCVCHQNPDGDALGSMLGWAECLRTIYSKDVYVVAPDQSPDFLHWLPGSERIIRYDKHPDRCSALLGDADLVFLMDLNTLSRTGEIGNLIAASPARKMLIDHHLGPDVDCDIMLSRPDASSTCELVFRLVWQMGLYERMNRLFAAQIYCGMMTDTGAFTFGNCTPDVFFIVGQLIAKGIDRNRIYRNVFHTFSENRLRLQGFLMYERLVVDTRRHASYYALSREDMKRFSFVKGDAEGVVNLPLQIKGHKLSISLREDTEKDNVVWVSLRSVDKFPCNEMAQRFFNGGGHLNASGGRLDCSLADAIVVAKQAIESYAELLES